MNLFNSLCNLTVNLILLITTKLNNKLNKIGFSTEMLAGLFNPFTTFRNSLINLVVGNGLYNTYKNTNISLS